jgi:hypothetical protein
MDFKANTYKKKENVEFHLFFKYQYFNILKVHVE